MGAYDDQVRADLAKTREALRSAENELRDRRQADARVRAQHQPYRSVYDEGDARSCAHCNQYGSYPVPWPCPTIQALNGDPK